MLSFKQFLLESQDDLVVYRGLTSNLNPDEHQAQKITWVSTSKEHSLMYAENNEKNLYTFKLQLSNVLDLGFRSSETLVQIDEIKSRLKMRIMEQFRAKKINEELAKSLLNDLKNINKSGDMMIWEWMYIPEIFKIIKDAKFQLIKQNEGLIHLKGNVVTYGVIDKKLLTKI